MDALSLKAAAGECIPITIAELAYTRAILEEYYEPMSDEGFRFFAILLQRKGWGQQRLEAALLDFVAKFPFRRWQPAEFFEKYTPKVYGYGWYQARVLESRRNADLIGSYSAPGVEGPVFGWSEELDDVLEPFIAESQVQAALPAHQGEISESTAELLQALRDRGPILDKMEELETERMRKQEQIEALQAYCMSLETANARLMDEISEIAEYTMGIEQRYGMTICGWRKRDDDLLRSEAKVA